MEERWKYLKECYDFKELRSYFSDEMLDYFETELANYVNDITDPEDATLIVHWYEGALTTEDLISEYDCYLTNYI